MTDSTTTHALDFTFDFLSPYAYLAWHAIHGLAEKRGRAVKPVPVLFAAMLDHYGHKGPAEIPPKRIYIFKHVVRIAHAQGIALQPPPAHPFNPLLALRIAGLDLAEGEKRQVIDALFDAVWAGGPGVTDPDTVARVLTQAGHDGGDLVARAGAPEAKARLRANTEAAIARGAFGVPTVIADGELFWGLDSLPHLDSFLAGNDPVSTSAMERWSTLPAQARRPGSA